MQEMYSLRRDLQLSQAKHRLAGIDTRRDQYRSDKSTSTGHANHERSLLQAMACNDTDRKVSIRDTEQVSAAHSL